MMYAYYFILFKMVEKNAILAKPNEEALKQQKHNRFKGGQMFIYLESNRVSYTAGEKIKGSVFV